VPHSKEMVKTTIDYLGLPSGCKVIDIGSNNGLLLEEYKNAGCRVIGFEPCDRIAQKARDRGIDTFSQFFNCATSEQFTLQYSSPELITCTNCFAHVSDLNDFVEALTIIMGKDTYFVFENAYLVNTLLNKDFGQAYFEHFYLHSLSPLEKLFKKHGLELFNVTFNNIQMGSFRGFVRRINNQSIVNNGSVQINIENEISNGLQNVSTYTKFINDINEAKIVLINELEYIKNQNKSISVYAWPAKMTLLNKYLGLEKYFDYIIEESSVKVGKFAPGTELELLSLEHFKNNPTDYCFIGAYNFADDIKRKNEWYKGVWIQPI